MPARNHNLNRETWRLALPMILSNLSTPLLGMVDTAVVGHLDRPYYLGAVALGGTIFSFLYWGFGFLRMGTTGLTAQAMGNESHREIGAILGRALILAGTLSAILIGLKNPAAMFAFHLLEASPEAEAYAQQYFTIRIFSAPATLANYACIGWFIGLQNTRIPLLLTLTINLVNIVLDCFFVWGMHWNVAGVAAASVAAEYSGLLLAGIFIIRRWRTIRRPNWREIFHWQALGRMFNVNANLFVRTLLLIFGFAFFTAQSAKLGDVVLAANTILLNLQSFMAYTLDGFAHAAEALTGRALGRRSLPLLRSAIATSCRWSFLFSLAFSLTYALTGEWIIRLLTSLEPVRHTAVHYLWWAILLPVVSVWSFLFDGIFIGLTRAKEMRNAMLFSLLGVYLPLWWWLQNLGNQGLWIAFTGFLSARALSMGYYHLKIMAELKRQLAFSQS
ncbi:MAG: MATE family efflux transporter [Methylohalobius sp. ZOD2]|nr:MATE family efflux transporter [Methylothermaceae bacterium]